MISHDIHRGNAAGFAEDAAAFGGCTARFAGSNPACGRIVARFAGPAARHEAARAAFGGPGGRFADAAGPFGANSGGPQGNPSGRPGNTGTSTAHGPQPRPNPAGPWASAAGVPCTRPQPGRIRRGRSCPAGTCREHAGNRKRGKGRFRPGSGSSSAGIPSIKSSGANRLSLFSTCQRLESSVAPGLANGQSEGILGIS